MGRHKKQGLARNILLSHCSLSQRRPQKTVVREIPSVFKIVTGKFIVYHAWKGYRLSYKYTLAPRPEETTKIRGKEVCRRAR